MCDRANNAQAYGRRKMSYILNDDRIVMGTDYYPEHWDESMWEDDIERMLKTGIEIGRASCRERV